MKGMQTEYRNPKKAKRGTWMTFPRGSGFPGRIWFLQQWKEFCDEELPRRGAGRGESLHGKQENPDMTMLVECLRMLSFLVVLGMILEMSRELMGL